MEIRLDQSRTPFSLDHTLSCGQTFRWEKRGEYWIGVADQTVFKIMQKNTALKFKSSTNTSASNFLWSYFRLDDNLQSVYSKIMKDEHVEAAVKQFRGLRLMRQEPWECLISYLCATHTNIPAIKQMVFNLCCQFGNPVNFEDEEFHTFPKPEVLAKASLNDLQLCKLGYRAENVLETAKLVSRGDFDLEALKTMPYEEAKEELLALPGVGPKVADCILLFSLDKLEAFPIDVWMKRIILEYYSQYFEPEFVTRVHAKKGLSPREYGTIYVFGREYFGEYLGYAQEYLYHHKRCEASLDRILTKES